MRKRTVRKVWQKVNPLEFAMAGASIMTRDDCDKLLARELSSLDALIHGAGGLDEWNDLVNVNNLAEALALDGVGRDEVMPTVKEVETHLIEAAERFQRTGKMRLTGPAIQAMRSIIEWHDLQRSSIARSQYERTIRKVTAQIKSGHVARDLWPELGEPRKAA
jgi:hypothetical protein